MSSDLDRCLWTSYVPPLPLICRSSMSPSGLSPARSPLDHSSPSTSLLGLGSRRRPLLRRSASRDGLATVQRVAVRAHDHDDLALDLDDRRHGPALLVVLPPRQVRAAPSVKPHLPSPLSQPSIKSPPPLLHPLSCLIYSPTPSLPHPQPQRSLPITAPPCLSLIRRFEQLSVKLQTLTTTRNANSSASQNLKSMLAKVKVTNKMSAALKGLSRNSSGENGASGRPSGRLSGCADVGAGDSAGGGAPGGRTVRVSPSAGDDSGLSTGALF